jgi:thymidylate synthase
MDIGARGGIGKFKEEERMKLYTDMIEGNNFHNVWAKALQKVVKNGTDLVIGGGEERKPIRDSCMLISLTGNAIKQVEKREIHPQYPFRRVDEYCEEFTRSYVRHYLGMSKDERFAYLYFKRLTIYPCYRDPSCYIDQIMMLRQGLADQIEDAITSNRDQAITWQVYCDNATSSPPCLQRIQIRYIPEISVDGSEGKVDVHLTWRSRDLYGAWQANVIAIVDMLNREIIKPNNCGILRIVDYSDSLHVYKTDLEAAKKVKMVAVSPQEVFG